MLSPSELPLNLNGSESLGSNCVCKVSIIVNGQCSSTDIFSGVVFLQFFEVSTLLFSPATDEFGANNENVQ